MKTYMKHCYNTVTEENTEKQNTEDAGYFISLIENICGHQTTAHIFKRVIGKENILYKWIRQNPKASKEQIRRMSHEIAGTLAEYEKTIGKRFYVILAHKQDVESLSYGNCKKFVSMMILGSDLMCAAKEIAESTPKYADLWNVCLPQGIERYQEVLERYGIDWKNNKMLDANVHEMDAEGVLALIVCTTWANRRRPGLLKPYLNCGALVRWLERLEELDN